jgi:protein HIRA/HIR1
LGIEQWVDRLPGRAVCAVGNSSFCAVGIADGSLFILSTTGRRLLPPLALGSAFSVMECSPQHSPFLLVILANGQLKVWNIALRKSILSESIEPIALGGITSDDESYTRKATLLRSQITTKGLPLVTFAVTTTSDTSKSSSSLQSFTFDLNLCSWLRIADDSFGYSDFKSSLPTEAVAIKDVPVCFFLFHHASCVCF